MPRYILTVEKFLTKILAADIDVFYGQRNIFVYKLGLKRKKEEEWSFEQCKVFISGLVYGSRITP